MTFRDDETAIIRDRLVDDLERLLDRYCADWVISRGRGYLAPKGKGDLGSWVIELSGGKRGLWRRHSQGIGGDVLKLIAYCLTGDVRVTSETFAEARDFLGLDRLPDPLEARRRREAAERRRRDQERVAAQERLQATQRARDIWRAAGPGAGSPVEAFLTARGVGGFEVPPTLRFHAELPYWWAEKAGRAAIIHRGPAMVALMTDGATGAFRGVHLTWLAPGGAGKARILAPDGSVCVVRKVRGAPAGAHVRLAPPGAELAVAEGIETAIAVALSCGRPVFAALSLGNLDAALPPVVRDLTLCADADEKYRLVAPSARGRMVDPDAVIDHAVTAHAGRGLRVRLARPPLGLDFRDWWAGSAGKPRCDLPLPPGLPPAGEEARAW